MPATKPLIPARPEPSDQVRPLGLPGFLAELGAELCVPSRLEVDASGDSQSTRTAPCRSSIRSVFPTLQGVPDRYAAPRRPFFLSRSRSRSGAHSLPASTTSRLSRSLPYFSPAPGPVPAAPGGWSPTPPPDAPSSPPGTSPIPLTPCPPSTGGPFSAAPHSSAVSPTPPSPVDSRIPPVPDTSPASPQ